MTGFLLDDPRCMTDDQERKGKVDKVFSDVEKLSQESSVPERYVCILDFAFDEDEISIYIAHLSK